MNSFASSAIIVPQLVFNQEHPEEYMRADLLVVAAFGLVSLLAPSASAALLPTVNGVVKSGNVNVAKSHVYLMAAKASKYGDPSVSLLTGTANHDRYGNYVPSSADGTFSLTSYSCAPDQQVYLLALGGKTSVSGTDNSSIALISALGACSSLATIAGPSIVVNEVSTVASVYALSGFLRDATHVASSASANAKFGLANAFLTRRNMADLSGNALPTTPTGYGSLTQNDPKLPSSDAQVKINELANILSTCVSSDGTGAPCARLFQAVDDGLFGQRDTVSVLRRIIDRPARNFDALYALNAKNGPFQPTHIVAPTEGVYPYPDWTLTIQYAPPNLQAEPGVTARFLAVDAKGNIWITSSASSVTELNPFGKQIFVVGDNSTPQYGLNGPFGIAIDPNGNVWVGNINTLALTGFDSNGGWLNNEPTTGFPALPYDGAVAIDSTGQIWLMSQNAHLCNYTYSASTPPLVAGCGNSPYTFSAAQPGDLNSDGLAIAPSSTVWVASHDRSLVGKVDAAKPASPITPLTTTGDFNCPMFLASNALGDIWVSDQLSDSLIAFDKQGAPLPHSPITGGGLCMPRALMFDGADTLWVGNYTDANPHCGNSISHFDHRGRPLSPTGLGNQEFTEPLGLAIDPSGNVWVADGQSNFVSEVVGAAVPVATPINPEHLGTRP
jgi:streptogramin lyase